MAQEGKEMINVAKPIDLEDNSYNENQRRTEDLDDISNNLLLNEQSDEPIEFNRNEYEGGNQRINDI